MKKVWQRSIALAMTIAMLTSAVPMTATAAGQADVPAVTAVDEDVLSGSCGENAAWTLKDGVLTISGTGKIVEYGRGEGDLPPWCPLYQDLFIEKVVIGSGITEIGGQAFGDCSDVTSVTIPDSVTAIGDWAFSGCDKLVKVTLPDSVVSIGSGAFSGCEALSEVSVPAGVTAIGAEAFDGTPFWENLKKQGDFVTVGGVLMQYQGAGGAVTIPDRVTAIGDGAFSDCTDMTSVVIPSGVTSIGGGAFWGCEALTSVTIPESVAEIGGNAFDNTPWLNNQGELVIVNDILLRYSGGDTNVTVPDGVKVIGGYAFFECTSVTSIVIPDSVISIEDGAFAHCSALQELTIPSSVMSIGGNAFGYCSALQELTVPSSVMSIGDGAFGYCSALTSISLPANLTELGSFTFFECESLTDMTIPDGVGLVGEYLFEGCTALKSVKLPAAVKYIGMCAFAGCESLTSLTIPDGVTFVGNQVAAECSSLTSVTIPGSVDSIGLDAFCGCEALTSVTIPSGVRSIGNWAFSGCEALTSVTIPSGVRSIGNGAFSGCRSLTSVTVPASVVKIGAEAFGYANNPDTWEDELVPGFTLYGAPDTAVERYAKVNGIPFGTEGHAPVVFTLAFTDVAGDSWYNKAVRWAVVYNITAGTDGTHFSPEDTCPRAQIVQLLYNQAGKPAVELTTRFSDVPSNKWYTKAVAWAVSKNITSGFGDGRFGPDESCTRAEVVQFLYNAAGKPSAEGWNRFEDVPGDAWYVDAVEWAVTKGITSGTDYFHFSPEDVCTRAEIVQFLYNQEINK